MARCRDCRWYPVERVKDAAGRVRADRVAICLWPVPDLPLAFLSEMGGSGGPYSSYMQPNEEHECPCFEERT